MSSTCHSLGEGGISNRHPLFSGHLAECLSWGIDLTYDLQRDFSFSLHSSQYWIQMTGSLGKSLLDNLQQKKASHER